MKAQHATMSQGRAMFFFIGVCFGALVGTTVFGWLSWEQSAQAARFATEDARLPEVTHDLISKQFPGLRQEQLSAALTAVLASPNPSPVDPERPVISFRTGENQRAWIGLWERSEDRVELHMWFLEDNSELIICSVGLVNEVVMARDANGTWNGTITRK